MNGNTEGIMEVSRKPLAIRDDPLHGIVNIEGVNYTYELLRGFAKDVPINKLFKIIKRENSTRGIHITLEHIEEK